MLFRIWFGQDQEMKNAAMSMLNGDVHPTFVYVTPESFYSPRFHSLFVDLYDQGHIARIVLDEVQVILEVSITRIQRPYSNVYHTVEIFQA